MDLTKLLKESFAYTLEGDRQIHIENLEKLLKEIAKKLQEGSNAEKGNS